MAEFTRETTTREILARLDEKLDNLKASVEKQEKLLEIYVPKIAANTSTIDSLKLGITIIFCLIGILIPLAWAAVTK